MRASSFGNDAGLCGQHERELLLENSLSVEDRDLRSPPKMNMVEYFLHLPPVTHL